MEKYDYETLKNGAPIEVEQPTENVETARPIEFTFTVAQGLRETTDHIGDAKDN